MKCPMCGAENPEGKKFCDDCGTSISHVPPAQYQPTSTRHPGQLKRALMVIGAIAIVAILVLAAVLAFVLDEPPSPEEVLVEWVDRMNSGDSWGAADLSVFSKMNFLFYMREIQYLDEEILIGLGTDKLSINYANEIAKDQVNSEDWYSDMLVAIHWLESSFGTVVEDYRGLACSVTAYDRGVQEVWIDSWPVFKIDSSWYLAARLVN